MTFADTIAHIRAHSGLLVRYAITGALGAVIQTATLYVWVTVFGLEQVYLFGAVIGFLLALIISFILQKYWTFRDHVAERIKKQFFWYGFVAVINVCINVGLLAAAKFAFTRGGLDFFSGWYLVAQVGIVGFASLVSFVLNYSVTFKDTPSPSSMLKNME